MKKILFLLFILMPLYIQSQVTIGVGEAADNSALLELRENADGTSNKGLLLPRVKLSSLVLSSPLPAHVNGMTVFTADGFFGNEYTEYTWTKVADPDFPGVIGTGPSIDLRTFGYGTYKVEVKYNATCIVLGSVSIIRRTDSVNVGVQPTRVCILPENTLANVSVNGENIKFYATALSEDALPLTTVLVDGSTYYVSQTKNDCESGRVPITIRIGDCTSIYVNPNLRMRVPF